MVISQNRSRATMVYNDKLPRGINDQILSKQNVSVDIIIIIITTTIIIITIIIKTITIIITIITTTIITIIIMTKQIIITTITIITTIIIIIMKAPLKPFDLSHQTPLFTSPHPTPSLLQLPGSCFSPSLKYSFSSSLSITCSLAFCFEQWRMASARFRGDTPHL